MYIFVDLDGTFLKKDISWKLFKHVLRKNPMFAFKVSFYYFFYGSAYVKSLLSPYFDLVNVDVLINKKLLEYLELQKGSNIILATGANEKIAEKIVEKYSVFKKFIASTDSYNAVGLNKLLKIKEMIGDEPFFYIADHINDLVIWKEAEKIGVVNPSKYLENEILKLNKNHVIFKT